MAVKRTVLRSSAGKKLYAVRKKDGKFSDIQTYERAHRADLAASAKSETSKKSKAAVKKMADTKKPAAKKPAKATPKKVVVRKVAAKKAPVKKA